MADINTSDDNLEKVLVDISENDFLEMELEGSKTANINETPNVITSKENSLSLSSIDNTNNINSKTTYKSLIKYLEKMDINVQKVDRRCMGNEKK